jgi:hypothetical protein
MSEKIQVMRDLATWVTLYGWKVYYDQKNTDDYPTFNANTNSKSDILLTKNNYSVMVEVKPGNEHHDLLDGFDQILKYAGEYYSGRVNYKTKITKKINAFVLATKYSRNGYLYSNESKVGYIDYTGFLAQEYNMTERPATHTFTRMLWRQWEKGLAFEYYSKLRQGISKEIYSLPKKPYVGVLIAKTLANRQIDLEPYLYLNSNIFVPMGKNEINYFEEC